MLLAFLAADDIPRALPAEHATGLPERLAATVADPLAYQQTIAALRRYSLVKTSTDALSVHRLVQTVVRHQLDPDQQRHWASVAVRLVRAAFSTEPLDPAGWPAAARLVPHVVAVADHAMMLGVDPEATAWLLAKVGAHVSVRADYPQAHKLHEQALRIREAHLGADHPDTATSLRYLAITLSSAGDLTAARLLLERALVIFETAWALTTPPPPLAFTASPKSWAPSATSTTLVATTSAPWPSARPAWAPTTPTPREAARALRRWWLS